MPSSLARSQPPLSDPPTPVYRAQTTSNIWPQALQQEHQSTPNPTRPQHVLFHLPFSPSSAADSQILLRSTMPPKSRQSAPQTTTPTSTSTPARASSKNSGSAQDIVQGIWNNYLKKTPQRVKLLDSFMAFLVVVGALQFLYCLIVGNFVRNSPPLYSHVVQFCGANGHTELTSCILRNMGIGS
jgi:hypothetical protein